MSIKINILSAQLAVTLKYLPKASSWHIMMIFCQVCNGSNGIHESYLEMNLYCSEFFIKKKKRFLWDLDICANVVNFKDTVLLYFYLRQLLWNLVTFIWSNVKLKWFRSLFLSQRIIHRCKKQIRFSTSPGEQMSHRFTF